VTEERTFSASENRCKPLASLSNPLAPVGVDASVQPLKPARLDAPADRPRTKPGSQQLPLRHHPVLPLGKSSQLSLPLRELVATTRLTCR